MISKLMLMPLVLAAAVSTAAQTSPWELGHPDAKLLMGLDLKSLRESAVGQSIRDQMTQKAQLSPAGVQSPLQAPLQAMALGLLEQIDRVFVSSPANVSASSKTNPPFLLVVEGRFPTAELKPFLKGTSRRYRAAEIYRTSKTDTTSVAFLEGGTLILGDEKSVLAAIDRRGRALPPTSALLGRAQAMAATHDFWMIAEGPLSKFQPASTGVNNPLASPLASQIASQLNGLDMGLSLRDGLQFEMSVGTASDAMAAQLTQLVSAQIQTAMLAQGNRPEAAEMIRKLQFGAEGNRVRMNIALTKDEFEHQLRTVQEARAMAGTTPPQPAARPAKPATPGKIVIYGLEGGPREIQTTH